MSDAKTAALQNLSGASLLIFGADGMLGRAVRKAAASYGMDVGGETADATDLDAVLDSLRYYRPDYIVNCAGYNGGIGFQKPFDIFRINTQAPLVILEAVRVVNSGVKGGTKVLMPVASCGYDEPDLHLGNCDNFDRLIEHGYLIGQPNPLVQPHGYAKRNTVLACRYAAEQHGIRAVTVCPPTLYGPGDRYELERAKFPAAAIRRLVDAVDFGVRSVQFWGTGLVEREVSFVADIARIIIWCLACYDDSAIPLNIGTDAACRVESFVLSVAKAVGYAGEIAWDASRPDGQRRKTTAKTRMCELLGDVPQTDAREAIRLTVEDYRARRCRGEFANGGEVSHVA